MGEGKLVSVIIPAYNSAPYLAKAVDSVLSQSYAHYEIIVIDDASTDSTGDLLKKYASNPKLSVLRMDVSGGPGVARNAGIKKARGEFIALLDADDYWFPEKLAKQLLAFQEAPDAGWAYSNGFVVDQNDNRLYVITDRWKLRGGNIYEALLLQNILVAVSSVIVKREVFEDCGYFDPDLKSVEDLDLFLRIARQYNCIYTEEPLINYCVHYGNMSRKEEIMEAGRVIILDKLTALHPEYASRLRHIHHRSVGIGMLGNLEVKKARSHFLQAMRYQKTDYKVWVGLLLALLPGFVLDKVIRLKKRCVKRPLF